MRRLAIMQQNDAAHGMVTRLEAWVRPRRATQNILGFRREIIIWEAVEKVTVITSDGVASDRPRVVASQQSEVAAADILTSRRLNILRAEDGWKIIN